MRARIIPIGRMARERHGKVSSDLKGTICQGQAGRASPVRKLPRQQDHETGTVEDTEKSMARRQDLI